VLFASDDRFRNRIEPKTSLELGMSGDWQLVLLQAARVRTLAYPELVEGPSACSFN
jgi:hypothetical protein